MKKLIALVAVVGLAGCADEPMPARPAPVVSTPAATPSTSPSLESGTAIPGAFCRTEGARRLTKAGEVATCTHNGERLQWKVTP